MTLLFGRPWSSCRVHAYLFVRGHPSALLAAKLLRVLEQRRHLLLLLASHDQVWDGGRRRLVLRSGLGLSPFVQLLGLSQLVSETVAQVALVTSRPGCRSALGQDGSWRARLLWPLDINGCHVKLVDSYSVILFHQIACLLLSNKFLIFN